MPRFPKAMKEAKCVDESFKRDDDIAIAMNAMPATVKIVSRRNKTPIATFGLERNSEVRKSPK
jgi:hypothetical protein